MANLEDQGWLLFESVYSDGQLKELQTAVGLLADHEDEAVRGRAGSVYAARNVLELVPEIISIWQTEELVDFLVNTLGSDAGLVRALYFDKPPEQTWALPWHKDLLIAVNQNAQPNSGYSRPRPRAGVLHSEPPVEVLESMLTLRIHLDAMTVDNGPLEVLSGSHITGKELLMTGFQKQTITSSPGAVFAMRPLLAHASGRSSPNEQGHRRVLHLEFSGQPELPGNVGWHTFHRVLPLKKNR